MDPLVVNEEKVTAMRKSVISIIEEINKDYSIHDFRVVESPSHTNLIFDLVIPYGHKQSRGEIADMIAKKVHDFNNEYYCVITVEHNFV
jgi:hypothetical protein